MTNLLTTIQKVQDSYKIDISEKHHKSKVDMPSGTAISLAEAANIEEKNIPVSYTHLTLPTTPYV